MLKKAHTSTRKATTFRLDQAKQAALANLSKILRRPMNHLVNEAVKVYLEQRSLEVERDLQTTLNSLRTHRQRDPNFKKAIAAFIDAEASLKDPIKSELTQDGSSVRTEIHRLLHG
jgi:predicted transcriptional regulator